MEELQSGSRDGPVQKIVQEFEGGNRMAVMRLVQLPDEVYIEGIPHIFAFFSRFDPCTATPASCSLHNTLSIEHSLTLFFAKWMQLSTQNQQLVKQYIGPLTLVIEWWAQLLAGKDGAVPGVASTLQQLLAPWAMVAMTDPAFGEEILPCAIKCMASKNDAVIKAACGIFSVISMTNKDAMGRYIGVMLQVLEAGVQDLNAQSLLQSVCTAYNRDRDRVHAYVDTVVKYAITGTMARVSATQLLSKIVKRAPTLLYKFVDELVPLLDDQNSCFMILSTLADIGSRNAPLIRRHIAPIQRAAEEITGAYHVGALAIGCIGRIDPEAAMSAQQVLVGWLRLDVDPQATPSIIAEIRNVSAVHTESLTPHIDVLRGYKAYGDVKVSEVANAIVAHFDGHQAHFAGTFHNQDIAARILNIVTEVVDSKTAEIRKLIEELSRKADHQSGSDDTRIGERVNAMEAAAGSLTERIGVMQASLDELFQLVRGTKQHESLL